MLPRAQRLSRRDDVRAVLRRGRRRAGDLVVVHLLEREDHGPGRATAVASRKVGGAVQRNRAKRVLRAAAGAVGLPAGADVALVARRATATASSTDVAAELGPLLSAVAGARTGLDA